jgi:hypothetical protein
MAAQGRIKHLSLREVRRTGRKDGRNWKWRFLPPSWPLWESKEPDPPITQKEPSQYESNLISITNQGLERLGEEWCKEDEKLKPEYCNAKDEKERLEEKIREETEQHKTAILTFESAKKKFEEFPPRWISQWLYWTIVLAIVTAEGLFNYFVFQMFGQEEWETYLMAGGVILVMPLASELLGHSLKKKERSLTDNVLMGLAIVVVIALLACLGILRETFFEASRSATIPMSPTTLAIILIVFNLAIFVVLTYLSYLESRADPEGYRKACRAYKGAKEALRKEGGDVDRVAGELAKAEDRLNKAVSARELTFGRYTQKAEIERDVGVSYIRNYRHANMEARKDRTLPESFRVDPETLVAIPSILHDIDWDCSGGSERAQDT